MPDQLVPFRAMCFAGVYGGEVGAPKNIGTLSYSLKMVGVYAKRVVANVINHKAFRNGPMRNLESDAMNVSLFFSDAHDGVPVPIVASKPNATTGYRNGYRVLFNTLIDRLALSGLVFHTRNIC